ncbi:T9SS type A sorting domain-containing protein [Neolewinella agarilytica]|uniref:T9SS type A sorting domain-containing protein n=1 Tax=Neolewinella agarilytica TaxID=478744 RepID=UPI0021CD1985|nr:T9SS type A sorting domain-containing protein [Neolewinella agarilytica]
MPANDVVNINFTAEASGEAVLSLTDMMGRTISQRSLQVTEGLQTQTVDLSNTASGAYLLRVNVDGRQMVKRIVRQ